MILPYSLTVGPVPVPGYRVCQLDEVLLHPVMTEDKEMVLSHLYELDISHYSPIRVRSISETCRIVSSAQYAREPSEAPCPGLFESSGCL